jgi:RimJ/RimL family protein N-acetyltransferase
VPALEYPQTALIPGGRLERWDPDVHTAGLAAMNEDPLVMRFLEVLGTAAQVRGMSDRIAGHWDEFGYGLWAVVPDAAPDPALRACAGFVGGCHPRWHPELQHRVEVGWRLSSLVWGRGYATNGGCLAAELCFSVLGLDRVIAFIDPQNAPSHLVAGRLGMTRIGGTHDPRTGAALDLLELKAGARPPLSENG